MKKSTYNSCTLCNSKKVYLILNLKNQLVVQCADCGFVFMNENPTQEELDKCYSTYSYSNAVNAPAATIASYTKLLQEFESFRKTNRILDYGCGQGWFMEEAKKKGWEVWGVEYSESAIKLGKEKDITVLSIQEAEKFEADYFDIVVMIEVIEHVIDIHEPIGKAFNWLRHGGLFYCTTPNFNIFVKLFHSNHSSTIITYPEHLSYFTKKTLRKLVEKHCFVKKKILTTGLSISVEKNVIENPDGNVTCTNRDEQIRDSIQKNEILRIVKNIVNFFLNAFGIGVTLKGYFIKK